MNVRSTNGIILTAMKRGWKWGRRGTGWRLTGAEPPAVPSSSVMSAWVLEQASKGLSVPLGQLILTRKQRHNSRKVKSLGRYRRCDRVSLYGEWWSRTHCVVQVGPASSVSHMLKKTHFSLEKSKEKDMLHPTTKLHITMQTRQHGVRVRTDTYVSVLNRNPGTDQCKFAQITCAKAVRQWAEE